MRTVLVICGGGMKGFTVPGALEVLSTFGYLDPVTTYAGTSIGGFIAGLLAVGYSASEMCALFQNTLFDDMKKHLRVGNLLEYGCLMDPTWWEAYVVAAIDKKYPGRGRSLTLEELHTETGKSLVMSTTRLPNSDADRVLKSQRLFLFNAVTKPHLPLYLLTMMSTAHPGLLPPVEFEGYLYVDGGAVDNYLIAHFPPERVLGIYLGARTAPTHESKPHEIQRVQEKKGPFKGVKILLEALEGTLHCMLVEMEQLRAEKAAPSTSAGTVKEVAIDTSDIRTVSFDFSPTRQKELLLRGMNAALAFVGKDIKDE